MPTPVTLTILSRPDCHLCDDARAVVTEVLGDFADVELVEKSILDDEELHERYVEDIPVVLINGKVHNYWRIDPTRLRSALKEVTA